MKLARIVRIAAYRRALRLGVAAAVEHDTSPLPHELQTVLDVGANRGQFALVALRRWPAAGLVCFEPIPEVAQKLRRVLGGAPGRRVVEVALSDGSGQADFHISRADDSSSLLPITDRQVERFPGTEEAATMRVRTARLDEELSPDALVRPVLLKLDVQGAELGVLRGASGLLHLVDVIVVECSFTEFYAGQALADAVVRFLHEHAFRLDGVLNPEISDGGTVLQADLLFRAT